MTTLLSFLLRPRLPLWQYCLATFPLALLPSAALFAGVYLLLGVIGVDTENLGAPSRSATVSELLGTVLFGPVVETVLLSLLLRALLKLVSKPLYAATASCLLWGALHAAIAPLWFFGTVWSFFIFSCAYIGWRGQSFHQAFAAACVPHSLINLSAMALSTFADAA